MASKMFTKLAGLALFGFYAPPWRYARGRHSSFCGGPGHSCTTYPCASASL